MFTLGVFVLYYIMSEDFIQVKYDKYTKIEEIRTEASSFSQHLQLTNIGNHNIIGVLAVFAVL